MSRVPSGCLVWAVPCKDVCGGESLGSSPPFEHLGFQVKFGFPFVIGVLQLHLYVLEIYSVTIVKIGPSR